MTSQQAQVTRGLAGPHALQTGTQQGASMMIYRTYPQLGPGLAGGVAVVAPGAVVGAATCTGGTGVLEQLKKHTGVPTGCLVCLCHWPEALRPGL
jgi:hypothetical protein